MQLFRYRLPFKKPFKTTSGVYTYREGLIIKEDYLSFSCFGDIAPLPGFSSESLEQVIAQFQHYYNVIEHYFMQVNGYDTWQSFADSLNLYPSLRFGLDTFVYDRLSKTKMQPLNKQLLDTSSKTLKINYTIGQGDFETNMNSINEAWENGYRTFKIKIGTDFNSEKKLIAKVRKNFDTCIIRVDANQAWDISSAVQKLTMLAPYSIEYCEQPVSKESVEDLFLVKQNSPVPIAADEAVCNLTRAKKLIKNKYVDVIIIKPMILGSYIDIAEIATLARENGIKIVFTSTFESGIGRLATAHLASCFGSLETAQGLSTGSFFCKDILDDTSCIKKGHYTLPEERGIGIEPVLEDLESVELNII